MRLLTTFFILVILGWNCQTKTKELRDYKVLAPLKDQEIQGFEEVIDFFSRTVCEANKYKEEDISLCYSQYLEGLHEAVFKTKSILDFQIPHQKQVAFIESLNPTTFSQVWKYGKTVNRGHDTIPVLLINPDGAYVDFLKLFGKENKKAQRYYDLYTNMNTISPTMYSDLLFNYKEYDVQDERMKLLIAVHCITSNDMDHSQNELKVLEKARLEKNKH